MKFTGKTRKQKRQRLMLILLGVFAVLLALGIVLGIVILGRETPPPEVVVPVPEEGESLKYNSLIAYPEITEEQIQYISVTNDEGKFSFIRDEDENGSFVLRYVDSFGNEKLYYPDICLEDGTFEYSSLFSIEENDGYKRFTKLSYLCLAIELTYFEERIRLSEDTTERALQLKEYGLSSNKVNTVYFTYKDADGNDAYHTVRIGDKVVHGTGYYFMVDDREIIYSTNNPYFDYALMGFESFIKATLVAEGLKEDNGFGPYLTSGYRQWKGIVHKGDGEKVTEDSRVIVYSDVVTPVLVSEATEQTKGGYVSDGYQLIEMDLSDYSKEKGYEALWNALVESEIGTYYDTENGDSDKNKHITVTLTSRTNSLSFGESKSLKYAYTITAIESVIGDFGEIDEPGYSAAEANRVKVTYTATVGGAPISADLCHAVIDLSESGIPENIRESLRASSVGSLDTPLNFEIEYTEQNSVVQNISYVISEIISIFDKKGKAQEKVTEESIVSYRYMLIADGESSAEEITAVIDLSAEDKEGVNQNLKKALVGRGVGKDLSVTVETYTGHFQYLYDFMTYRIARIDYFVTKELICAFRFQNSSDRDPFYGESIYENLMEDEHRLYGLNATSCDGVVKILGGIDAEGQSSTAYGLFGSEVVALGLTPDVMEKYNLYDHTVYFELPKGIQAYTPEGKPVDGGIGDDLDDYYSYETIGFTLYISDADYEGYRYVGSDMYDIVTRMDAETFEFLDFTFEEFWARRNVVLMDVERIQDMKVEFFMEDMKGSYDFKLNQRMAYIQNGYKYYAVPESGSYSSFNEMTVVVTPGSGDNTPTRLTEFIAEKGYSFVSLTEFFDTLYAGEEYRDERTECAPDSIGTTYYKKCMELLYYVTYDGVVSDEDQAKIMSEGSLLLRLSFKIKSSAYRYVYEFRRADDRRVMVTIYQADSEGNVKNTPVSDFYLSSFAFKKIAGAFFDVMNGVMIDPEVGYPERAD